MPGTVRHEGYRARYAQGGVMESCQPASEPEAQRTSRGREARRRTRHALAHAGVGLGIAAEQDGVGLGEVGQATEGVLRAALLHHGLRRVHNLAHRLRQLRVLVDLVRHDVAVLRAGRLGAHLQAAGRGGGGQAGGLVALTAEMAAQQRLRLRRAQGQVTRARGAPAPAPALPLASPPTPAPTRC